MTYIAEVQGRIALLQKSDSLQPIKLGTTLQELGLKVGEVDIATSLSLRHRQAEEDIDAFADGRSRYRLAIPLELDLRE